MEMDARAGKDKPRQEHGASQHGACQDGQFGRGFNGEIPVAHRLPTGKSQRKHLSGELERRVKVRIGEDNLHRVTKADEKREEIDWRASAFRRHF